MPEPEDILDKGMESVGTGTLENDGTQTQPSQSQGAAYQDVVDLDKDCAHHERKKMAPRSDVWTNFTKIKDDKGIMRAPKCKYCQRNMKAYSKGHGTSALKRHLQSCKHNPNKFEKDGKQGYLQAIQGEGVSTWKFDQDALREAFAEMIIEDELPLLLVKSLASRNSCLKLAHVSKHHLEEHALGT